MKISQRFATLPLETFITVVGYVKRRPENRKNDSLATGTVEVHVEEIVRVQKYMKYKYHDSISSFNNKRTYSSMVAENPSTFRGITSNEYKKAATSENILQYFNNREFTCDSLRLSDVNKTVTLVGWIDCKQKTEKFVQLHDGYGHTQLIIESDNLRQILKTVTESDLVLVNGRVVARPHSHQMMVR